MKKQLLVIALISMTIFGCEKQAGKSSAPTEEASKASPNARGKKQAVTLSLLAESLDAVGVGADSVKLTWTNPANPIFTFIQESLSGSEPSTIVLDSANFVASYSIYQPDWIASTGSAVVTKTVYQASGTTMYYRVSGDVSPTYDIYFSTVKQYTQP
jgi:hypothetical protein